MRRCVWRDIAIGDLEKWWDLVFLARLVSKGNLENEILYAVLVVRHIIIPSLDMVQRNVTLDTAPITRVDYLILRQDCTISTSRGYGNLLSLNGSMHTFDFIQFDAHLKRHKTLLPFWMLFVMRESLLIIALFVFFVYPIRSMYDPIFFEGINDLKFISIVL